MLASKSEEIVDPVRMRDIAFTRKAFDKMVAVHKAQCAEHGRPTTTAWRAMNVARDMLQDLLRDRRATLSAGKKRFVLRVLGLRELPSVVQDVPEALSFLPKKPPGHPDYVPNTTVSR